MRHWIKTGAGATAALLALGAALGCSAFRPSTQRVTVTCTPPDAVLMINGRTCSSPAVADLKRNRYFAILCYKDGYAPYERTIKNHFNETGVLDAAGTCFFLLPGVGLFFPGAWSLDETAITVVLFPK